MQQFEMSYFCPPITNKVPSRTVTLLEVARLISSEALRPQTETLRSISDKAEARAYKGRCLPYVTPSGVFTYCNDQSLVLGFSLASGLGSEGHDLYHQLCSQSPKYNEADCERKWQECISKSDGRTTLATFYSMAKQAGIDLSRISREFKPETIYHF